MVKTREAYPGLKAKWMKFPAECFKTLTFGELKPGQKFICLPMPGDNSGHGGFRGAHYLFVKALDGQAIKYGSKLFCKFPDSMDVILVE